MNIHNFIIILYKYLGNYPWYTQWKYTDNIYLRYSYMSALHTHHNISYKLTNLSALIINSEPGRVLLHRIHD